MDRQMDCRLYHATSGTCLEPYPLQQESCRLDLGIVWYVRIPDQSG